MPERISRRQALRALSATLALGAFAVDAPLIRGEEQAGQLATRHPNAQLVIDHLGLQQPFEPPAPPSNGHSRKGRGAGS